MRHSQMRIYYRPKKDSGYSWVTTGVVINSYIDFQSSETIEKKQDAGQLPIRRLTFYNGYGTYSSGTLTYTCTGANWITNQFMWHTLVNNNNHYVIESNTSDTITLAPATDFNWYGVPANGDVTIQTPDFEFDDIFIFYAWNAVDGDYTEPTTDDSLIFIGQIVAIDERYADNGNQIMLKLGNTTELLLKFTKKWLYYDTGSFPKAYEKIHNIIDIVNNANKNSVQLEWDAGNPTVKQDTTDFPDVIFYKDTCSAYEAMYELSTDRYTDDGEYYLFVKPYGTGQFKLIWQPKDLTAINSLVEGIDFKLVTRQLDKGEIISALYIKAGMDCKGNYITKLVYGNQKYGSRWLTKSENFASTLMLYEITANPSSFDTKSGDGDELLPLTTALPYTTATLVTQEEIDNSQGKLTTTGAQTFATKKEYNTWIRDMTMSRANIWGTQYLLFNNNKKEKIVINYYNQPLSAVPGKSDQIKIPSIGWTGGGTGEFDNRKILRMIERQISVNESGISLQVTYEQDYRMTTI